MTENKTYLLSYYQPWLYALGMSAGVFLLFLCPLVFVFVVNVFPSQAANGFTGLAAGFICFFLLTKLYIHKGALTFSASEISVMPTGIQTFNGELHIPVARIRHFSVVFQKGQRLLKLKLNEPRQTLIIYLTPENYVEIWTLLKELMPEKEKK